MNKLILAFLFLPLVALADLQPFFQFEAPHDMSVTATAAVALNQDTSRRYLRVQNKGAANVYLRFGATISGSEGITLSPAQDMVFYPAPINSVYAKALTGTNTVVFQVGK
jgi:hypothetical protein